MLLLPLYILYKLFLSLLTSEEKVINKVVLVTGASSGIGEQIAYQYAKRGARLVICARREELLKKVAMNAQNLGSPEVLVIPTDVSKLEDCKDMVEKTITRFGRLDHLVLNAGLCAVCPFEEIENISAFKELTDVNFWGYIYTTHYAIPHLRRSKGKVIVNASIGGLLVGATTSIYCASKAALVKFYETLRQEMSDVEFTIVTLGFVDTDMTRGKFMNKDGKLLYNQKMPDIIKFLPKGSAEDCAKAILRAASRGKRHLLWPTSYWIPLVIFTLLPQAMEWLALRLVMGRN
ncbi:hypothetical protein ACLOJK_002102 [Asimina triloba]